MENVPLQKISLGFAAVGVDSLILSRVVWEMCTKVEPLTRSKM